MPRAARLDTPGLLHHIMIRGVERRKIFNDDKDRENLIERLSIVLPETKTQCYAWSFLSNHAHFLFRSGPRGIADLMRRLLTCYAVSYNRRHRRHGQLFQNRYKSVICQEDRYLQELVRYIHLNPLRAKVVTDLKKLDRYSYCGHSALMGKKKREWHDIEYVLGFFGKRIGEARKKYRLKSRGYNFEKVAERVSSLFDLEKDYITARGRQRVRVRARDILCYWCAIELGIPMADLAKRLEMTLSAVSYAVKRGEKTGKEGGFHLDD